MQAAGARAHQRVDVKGSDMQDRSGEGAGLTDHSIYISLPVAVMRYSDKDNLRETGLIFSSQFKVPSIMAGKSRHQEPEDLSHSTPTVRKQQ